MLIRPVLAGSHSCDLFFPGKRGLQVMDPSSLTRLGWFSLSTIDQYSSLLPPVGVWTVSQFQIVGLVGRYPANYLMSRVPVPYHRGFKSIAMRLSSVMGC